MDSSLRLPPITDEGIIAPMYNPRFVILRQILTLVRYFLLAIFIWAVIEFVLGIAHWASARGDLNKVSIAKSRVKKGAIVTVIIFILYFVLNLVVSFIGLPL